MERAVVLAADRMTSADISGHVAPDILPSLISTTDLNRTAQEIERTHILETLERLDWNTTQAAKQLGIGRTTLWRKLKRYRGEDPHEPF